MTYDNTDLIEHGVIPSIQHELAVQYNGEYNPDRHSGAYDVMCLNMEHA